MIYDDIASNLVAVGLRACGYFLISEADALPLSQGTLILVGQTADNWSIFQSSAEYVDGLNNPLDRYSRRVCSAIAEPYSGIVFMPSDGPPFLPFQNWAQRVEAVHFSQLGLLMHPVYGLWHAYRAAIALPIVLPLPSAVSTPQNKCDSCNKKCLSACPVHAFSKDFYDVNKCRTYLHDNPQSPCHYGCLARGSCPPGNVHRYGEEHRVFLMQQFGGASRLGKKL